MTGGAQASPEEAFFRVLQQVLPGQVLYNGDGGAAASCLRSAGLSLPNAHWDLDLPKATGRALEDLLQSFGGTHRNWAKADLLANIDGLITGPPLGPCLVEFDEEEHFSPYRLRSLALLEDCIGVRFDLAAYRRYCTSPPEFEAFWRKCRLPDGLLPKGLVIESHAHLAAVIARGRGTRADSGYTRTVRGFPFAGGRIAQRAYYDSLADCIHLAGAWRDAGVRPTCRVAVWELPELRETSTPVDFPTGVGTRVEKVVGRWGAAGAPPQCTGRRP